MGVEKNQNKVVYDSLIGKTILNVEYSDDRGGEDYVTLILSNGEKVVFHAKARNTDDITWIVAEVKGA